MIKEPIVHFKEQHNNENNHKIPHENHKHDMTRNESNVDKRLEYNDIRHLNEVMKEIVAERQKDGYENFEDISMYVRQKMTKLSFQYKPPVITPERALTLTLHEEQIFKALIKKKPKIAEPVPSYIQDVIGLSKVLEWGGISFNKNEWYKIRIALKKLLLDYNAEFIRFWGKIYGINSDYYIIQGLLKNYPMKNPNPHVEARGNEGINRYTFWVSDSILEAWYELPDITSEQLAESRLFKYHFTGDLNSKVKAFRNFSGRECHLLKCQIVRILHSSSIVPKGYLKSSENWKEPLEGKIVEYDEEYKSPSFDELKVPEVDAWIHEHAYIYDNGKVIDPSNEKQVERMKSIADDEGYKIYAEDENKTETDMKYWRVKVVGDVMIHSKPNQDLITHAVIVAKNLRWPGTACVWKDGQFVNIYVGFAIKATGSSYYPTQHGIVDKEPEDVDEHPEPNPDKEPVIPEPDTDDEKKAVDDEEAGLDENEN